MSPAASPERQAWIDKAAAADLLDVAARLGATLKRSGTEHVGPCPSCGGTDRFAINPRKRIFNCRGADGGDVIQMVRHVLGLDFNAAVEWIAGEPFSALSASGLHEREATLAQLKARRDKADAKRETDDADYRAKEIDKAEGIWSRGVPIEGTLASDYLAARGIDQLPPRYELRFEELLPYWHQRKGDDTATAIHTGPALLGMLSDDRGAFAGCHVTWLDPGRPGRKLALPDPDNPGALLPAKKLRGSTRRAAEKIQTPRGGGKRMVLGEGRETVLSVWLAEASLMKCAWTHYWSGYSLGHIGGKAAGQINHPTLLGPKGKPARVGNAVPLATPDRDLVIPDEITELVLLGDGDSDRFNTEMTLRRAAARFERQGRVVKAAWAPGGMDFNDMLQGAV